MTNVAEDYTLLNTNKLECWKTGRGNTIQRTVEVPFNFPLFPFLLAFDVFHIDVHMNEACCFPQ